MLKMRACLSKSHLRGVKVPKDWAMPSPSLEFPRVSVQGAGEPIACW